MTRTLALSLLLTASGCEQGSTGMMASPDMAGGGEGGTGPGGLTFRTETLDADASGSAVALVIDGAGASHVLYLSSGPEITCTGGGTPSKFRTEQLWHASRAAAQAHFAKSKVADNVAPNGIAALRDLKTGRPVISFQGGQPGARHCAGSDMMLGRHGGAAWTLTTVAGSSTAGVGAVETSGDVVGLWSALAMDKGGASYLCWQDVHFGFADNDFSKADLECASGTDWSLSAEGGTGVAAAGAGRHISAGVDRMGRLVLAYSAEKAGGVSFAVRTARDAWQISPLRGGGVVSPSLAVAPLSGRIGVAYFDSDLRVLRLAESEDGVRWQTEVVDSEGDVGRVVGLRYDRMDRPVMAYYSCGAYRPGRPCDPAMDSLRAARRVAEGTYVRGTVDTGGDGACGTALAMDLDGDGRMHVAYQCSAFDHQSGQFKGTVRYAKEE